jgi:L-amino acid N-acyltransferase YncA
VHITIRAATAEDADGIAAVHVHAWREAYAHLLSPEFLAAMSVERRATGWRRIIDDSAITVVVAVADHGAVVGWATSGPGRDDDAPAARELEGIYLLAADHGSGAGQGLLDAVIGAGPAYLWVAEDNPRAHAFYRRNGFIPDGAYKVDTFGTESIAEVRLVR